jgi:hypothetical protein
MITVPLTMILVPLTLRSYRLVIVTNIWQKLSSAERDVTLIATNFWQFFSHIFGETSLIVTTIWPNPTSFRE